MLLRRLSRIFSQGNDAKVAPPVSSVEAPQKQTQKRSRSATIGEDTDPATSKTSQPKTKKHAKSDLVPASGSSRARKNADRHPRSHRRKSKISDVATGRASAGVPRSDRVGPTATSSSYNLRKR
ncbi:hypothetical protein C8J55DRAFT_516885 [Lentinula edodes]|uniref:Uncharacterized protein n=2 Tax=Lentinula TaxID=5352 RepID=A0A9W9A8T6_9AGAR|nr:hypothetical protein C8J55DRAFT_516885 [Lentinula edodes]